MTEPQNFSRTSISNRGIGFVVIGLLTGVLLTLWFGGMFGSQSFPVEVNRAVELGAASNAGVVAIPESEMPTQYLDVMSMNEVFKAVSSTVTPTVVFIEVASQVGSDLFSSLRQRGGTSQSLGSGVIISRDGYIVTNNHVIDDAEFIRVTLNDKREFEARIIGTDPTTDLAVIKIDPESTIPVVPLGDGNGVEVGEWVLAVGNPFRLTSTVTAGIVSATGRSVNVIDNSLGIESFIQTDAAINPGNSGGALVNLRGELVGIATAIATESGSYEGYGFAVPVDLMERVVRDLIRYGEVRRGYLGVSIVAVNARMAEQLGLNSVRGVYLDGVQRGLAGYKAGLRDGDVLLSVNGREMSEANELQSAIALLSPGDVVPVEIWRNGRTQQLSVTLKGRQDPGYANWINGMNQAPPPPVQEQIVPRDQVVDFEAWGIGAANLNNRSRQRFGVAHGVYLAYVTRDGLFEKAGVERGAVMTHINDVPVYNIETLRDALRGEEELLVRVLNSDGTASFYEVGQ